MRIRRMLAALWACLMLLGCLGLAMTAVERERLRAALDDVNIKLTTSRGREARQQAEYDEAAAALPEARAAWEELSPQVEAAVARETALKAERRQKRAERDALKNSAPAAGEEAEVP